MRNSSIHAQRLAGWLLALGGIVSLLPLPPVSSRPAPNSAVLANMADLAITGLQAPAQARANSALTYTLVLTNFGPDAADSVTVSDTLPTGTSFVSCQSTGGGVCGGTGNNRTVSFTSLAAGASAVITLSASVNCAVADGTLSNNTASVSAATMEPNTGNNAAMVTTTIANPIWLYPASQSFAANGGSGSVKFKLPSGCAALVSANAPWITITGNSNGLVTYSVAPHSGGSPRSGAINIAGRLFTVLQGAVFSDVPETYPFYTFIGQLSARAITQGCGSGLYCPDSSVTREQMAAFIIRALHERGYLPPPPAQQRFADVPSSNPFYAHIEEMALRQITLGCSVSPPLYCPAGFVTREQMAAFIIRALHEPGYVPPSPAQQRFDDVPSSNPFYAHIEEMALRQITLGCSATPSLYCPTQNVTRGQMAAFLIRAFDNPNLPPAVNAGSDQSILLPTNAVTLSGVVVDDSLPSGGPLTASWSKLSGPGTVTFNNPNAAVTQATFSAAGVYVLRLTGSDSVLATTDEVTVAVTSPLTINAGADQVVTLPNTAFLAGMVTGGAGNLRLEWHQQSGPDTVIFSAASAVTTTAIFRVAGVYVLRLTALDAQSAVTDEVQVMVNADPTPPPSDPSLVALPLDLTVATTIGAATQFLYTGGNPIQTGVAAGTIKPERAAVLKGRVLDQNNQPLSLVKITVLGHPEFGQTLSRADGRFDLAVNGGGPLTVKYEKVGFLPVQRCETVPWQDYCGVPDVVLIGYDANVTLIDLLSSAPIQVAQGSAMTDSSGTRRARLLFKQGTTATLKLPGGALQSLDKLHLRATEFTVGANGPNAMPGDLPPTSAYTYATKFSFDEAEAAGAVAEFFSQPVIQYLENFLNFPVGIAVPSAYYDVVKGVWVPSTNGRVVKLLSISGGTANLDVNGNGQPATDAEYAQLGLDSAERQTLATLYAVNQSLWRVPFSRFSPVDLNFPGAVGGAGGPPNAAAPNSNKPPDNQNECPDCIIGVQGQTLSEEVNVVGTPFLLRYDSHRTPAYQAAYTLNIPLSGATIPAAVLRIDLEVSIAGQIFRQSFPAAPNQATTFTWDGKDAYGRTIQGRQTAVVTVGFVYAGVYYNTVGFGQTGNGVPLFSNPTRREVTLLRRSVVQLGAFDMRSQGLGGWTLSVHHTYDPLGRVLNQGDGAQRSVETVARIITTSAGNGGSGYSGDGVPATQASFGFQSPRGVAVAPDGSVYAADTDARVIRRIAPNGSITTVAGTPNLQCSAATAPCGDGGQALQAQFIAPFAVAFGPDGSYYVADPGANKVRQIAPNGIITTVAGTGQACAPSTDACGDTGPATQAKLNVPLGVTVTPDGAVYIGDGNSRRVRRVGPDGIITTVAGSGNPNPGSCSNNNVPARQACLGVPFGVAVASDGTLYFSDGNLNYLFRVDTDGLLRVVAGDGTCGLNGDGGPATSARLCSPEGITRGPDNAIYLADWANHRIRRVGPDGIITTVAGTGVIGFSGDNGPATLAQLRNPLGVACGLDNSFYIADGNNQRIRQVLPPLPGFTNTDIAIPSADGNELYQFNGAGRHLRTINTLTGATRYTFNYDGAGRLISIVDGDNNTTTIQRNGQGDPTGVLSPFNQLTSFTLNANGYLATISNPNSETHQFTYNTSGLLSAWTDPRNHQVSFTYDALGRLLQRDDPATGFQQNFARNEQGQNYTVTRTTSLNRTSSFQVQELTNGDRQRLDTLPSGLQLTTLERANGMNTANDPDGTMTNSTLGPDPRWRMQAPLTINQTIATPGALNFNRSFTRTVTLSNPADPLSLVTQNDTTTINSRNYTNNYTAATRTFVFNTPLGRQTTTTTDTQSRPTAQVFANLNPAAYTYDARGRLATATFGSGMEARSRTYSYHTMGAANGALASITNALSQVTSFGYDAALRVNQITLPDTRVVGLGYDANGNLTSLTPPGRPAHTFTFTPTDLIASYTPPAVAGAGPTLYAYNLDQQLTTITRPDALTINYAYDAAGRLSTLTTPSGVYTYSYSGTTGKLTGLTAPGSQTLAFAYDGFLPTSMTWSGTIAGSVSRTFNNFFLPASQSVNGGNTVNFTYNNDNLLIGAGSLAITRHAQNGLITGTSLSIVSDTRGYNGFGELANYSASFNATPLYATTYTRDKLGRITQKVESIQGGAANTYDYTYDATGRLTQVKLNTVTISTYVYDSNNNRASFNGATTGTYDAQDRMTAYGAATFTYTANGELLTKTMSGMTTNYTYDVLGNLRTVTLPDTTQIEYVYDGLNRRVGKKVGGVLQQGFLYQNQLKPVAELDSSNNLLSRFVYGTRFNVPDYVVKAGVTYRIIADHLGSVRLVVNAATGAVAQRIDYDEFGVVTLDTNPGFQPFGFAGGLYDSQTKLVRFGARDYDAESGRWTAKDPILFAGRDSNLYSYAQADPVNRFDPDGLITLPNPNAGGEGSEAYGEKQSCSPDDSGGGAPDSPTVFDRETDPPPAPVYPWRVINTIVELTPPVYPKLPTNNPYNFGIEITGTIEGHFSDPTEFWVDDEDVKLLKSAREEPARR